MMKKILFLSIPVLFVLFSCSSEPKTDDNGLDTEKNPATEQLSEAGQIEMMEGLHQNLIDTSNFEPNKEVSVKLLEAAQQFIVEYPESDSLKKVITYGSSAAQGLEQNYEAIRLLSVWIDKNNSNKLAYNEMLLRAFLYEKSSQYDKAKTCFEEIIEKFPNHPDTENYKVFIETLGMSAEEINDYFNKKNAK